MSTRSATILTVVTCLAALGLAAFGMGLLDVGEGILVFLSAASLAGACIVALLFYLERREFYPERRKPSFEPPVDQPHRGINMSHIPIAGFPGFVFAVGFVWMFWFGVPAFRPIVVGVAAVGGLTGVVLVIVERRHRVPTYTPLGLSHPSDSAPHEGGGLPPA